MLARSAAQNPVWCFSCFAQVLSKKVISQEDFNDVAGIQPGAGGVMTMLGKLLSIVG